MKKLLSNKMVTTIASFAAILIFCGTVIGLYYDLKASDQEITTEHRIDMGIVDTKLNIILKHIERDYDDNTPCNFN